MVAMSTVATDSRTNSAQQQQPSERGFVSYGTSLRSLFNTGEQKSHTIKKPYTLKNPINNFFI
jgi:hypothetical protein